MSGALVNILNKVLGSWIENLNTEQFSLSIFSGTVELENLKLKSDIFQVLGLPIKLQSGTIGSVKLKIPWSAWYSSPLIIDISDLNILISPLPADEWTEKDAKDLIEKNKKYLLKQFEMIHEEGQDYSSSFSFLGSVSSKVVNNLCVKIKNFYIRLEDNSTLVQPFAIGCYLKDLELFNCNSSWQADNESTGGRFKLMLIDHIFIFLDYEDGIVESREWYDGDIDQVMLALGQDECADAVSHKFILHPFSARVEVVVSETSASALKPKISVRALTDLLNLDLNINQVKVLVKFQKYLTAYSSYIKGIEKSVMDQKFDLEKEILYLGEYRKYRKRIKDGKSSQEKIEKTEKKLKKLEEKIPANEIMNLRRKALMEIKIDKIIQDKEKEIREVRNPGTRKFTEILTGFFNRKSIHQEQLEQEERNRRLTLAESELKRTLLRTTSVIKQVSSNLTEREPETIVKWLVELKIGKISVLMKEERSDYFDLQIFNIEVKTKLRPYSLNLEFCISDIWMFNLLGKNKAFPKFLDGHRLRVGYESLGNKYLNLESSGLSLFLDLDAIIKISKDIKQSFSIDKDWMKYLEDISDTTERYIMQGSQYLFEAIETGVNSNYILDVKIGNVEIVVPLEVNNSDTQFFLAGFRQLTASTEYKCLASSQYQVYVFILDRIQATVQGIDSDFGEILKPSRVCVEFYNPDFVDGEDPDFSVKVLIDQVKTCFTEKSLNMIGLIYGKYNEINWLVRESSGSKALSNSSQRKEDFKSVFHTQINEFSVLTVVEEKTVFALMTENIKLRVQDFSNFQRKLKIFVEHFQVVDLRNPVFLNEIVKCSKAGQKGQKKEYQVIISGNVDKKNNTTDLSGKISDILIRAEIGFLQDAQKTFDLLSSSFSCGNIMLVPTVSLSRPSVVVSVNSRISMKLENFKLVLPVPEENSWETLETNTNMLIVVITEEKIEKKINRFGAEIWRKSIDYCNEMNIMLNHFCLDLGSGEYKKNLIKSTRISVDFCKHLRPNDLPETNIQTRMESLDMVLGFRDLSYVQKVKNDWFSFLFPKTKTFSQFLSTQTVDFDSLKITLQEDTVKNHFSLANLSFSNFLYTTRNCSGDFKCFLTCVFYMDFYNSHTGVWEPLIEDWKFNYSFGQKSHEHPSETLVESKENLNVNITKYMCETVGIIYRRFYQNARDWEPIQFNQAELRKCLDYKIINNLGISLKIWFVEMDEDMITLPDKSCHSIENLEMKKIFSRKKPKNKFEAGKNPVPSASLIPEGYSIIKNLILEDIGTEKFYLSNQNEKVTCRKHIKIDKNTRVITFCRDFIVKNLSSLEITFLCGPESAVICSDFFIPMTWDIVLIKIHTFLGPKSISENSCIEIQKNSFVSVQISEISDLSYDDCSTITIFPSYTVTNLLPCPIHVSLHGEKILTAYSGETASTVAVPYPIEAQFCLELDQVHSSLFSDPFNIHPAESPNTLSMKNSPWEVQLLSNTLTPSSVSLKLSCQYILQNCSEFPIFFSEKLVEANTLCLFSSASEELKIKTVGEFESSWSDCFNPKAVGVSSCLFLKLSNPIIKLLSLGLKITQAPSPLSFTKVIKIVPRFIIVNYLDFSIYIRQFCKVPTRIVEIPKGKHVNYQFDDISQGSLAQVSEDKLQWSGPFDLSVFEDFQVRFKAAPREIPPKTNFFAFETHWYLSCPRNHLFFYIRVCVSSEDDACIKITFSLPLIPAFRIYNSLSEPISVKQSKTNTQSDVIPPGVSLPWAFYDNTLKNKKVSVKYKQVKQRYSLEKIKERNKDLGEFLVSINFQGECRVLTVYQPEETRKPLEIGLFKKIIEKSSRKSEVNLSGIHLSLLDEGLAERFLISFQDFTWKSTRNEDRKNKRANIRAKYNMIIGGLQIDNMKVEKNHFPVMAYQSETHENTPFFEFRYDREFTAGSLDSKYYTPVDRILELEIQMQPLNLHLNTDTLFAFLTLSDLYYKAFYNITPDTQRSGFFTISELYPGLAAKIFIPDYCQPCVKSYFKYIRIHGSKLVLTFNNESVSTSTYPEFLHSLNEYLDLANIQDTNLKFTEIILQYSFQNFSNLSWIIIKNFIRQGLLQFYRVLGSSELLGNPLGLIDKLGTGVYEFFNEPAKGLLQGPKGFVSGVGKGVKSLVANVIGGSFESVSKLTGSLYKIVGHDKKKDKSLTHKLGLKDLTSGVKGIITKPYKGLKNKGTSGLIIGVGSGVFGALVSPVAAVLHFSATLSSEVARTAQKLNSHGQRSRVRFPRYRSGRKILEPYNDHLAKIWYFLALKELKESQVIALVELERENIVVTVDKIYILVGDEIVDKFNLRDFTVKEVHLLQKQFVLKLSGEKQNFCISSDYFSQVFKLFAAIKLIKEGN